MTVAGRSFQAGTAGRLGVVLALALYAGLATMSGIDRLIAAHPGMLADYPKSLQVQGLARTTEAVIAQDPRRGLAMAQELVWRAPLEPASTAMLGGARLRLNDASGSEKAMQVAGMMGWRVPFTQIYWMSRALEVGDYNVASMRLDALLRQYPAYMTNGAIMAPMESTPEGRAALAARARFKPQWLAHYTTDLDGVSNEALMARAGVLKAMAPDLVGCNDLGMLVQRLVNANAIEDAAQIWHAQCPDTRKGYVYDADFAKATINQDHSVFAWMFNGNADVTQLLTPLPGNKGQQLTAQTSSSEVQPLVQQLVLAPKGNYRLSWKAADPDGRASSRILAGFTCNRARPASLDAAYDKADGRWHMDLVQNGACAAAWLQFWITPGETPVVLSDIALNRAD